VRRCILARGNHRLLHRTQVVDERTGAAEDSMGFSYKVKNYPLLPRKEYTFAVRQFGLAFFYIALTVPMLLLLHRASMRIWNRPI
jgi:hypothetical protein